jgi:N-dimethylarginine dimethylaminohydrolase
MMKKPVFLMTDPGHFEVCYQINPWMSPDAWRADPKAALAAAKTASGEIAKQLRLLGADVEMVPAVQGLPDLVFPANAAIVLDRRVLLAKFRHRERQGEEAVFATAFAGLQRRGLVDQIVEFPDGIFQEGAGDCIWDADRDFFWAGHGPRSSFESIAVIADVFGQDVVALELASERFYHLDTCFCPLAGGNVLYYPQAFTPAALADIRRRIPESQRIEASDEEAAAFCVNAVNIGTRIVMAKAPASLKAKLAARGYHVCEVDLSPFMLSGGAAYCMTLRLDRATMSEPAIQAAE